MALIHDPNVLPAALPVSEDDDAARHLAGTAHGADYRRRRHRQGALSGFSARRQRCDGGRHALREST
jgi:hypothetical protein